MDLLISYFWNSFVPARNEALRFLKQCGDPDPEVKKTSVPGIAVGSTSLNSRDVIRKCKEFSKAEGTFRFAIKWVPVDFWCDTDLDPMKKVIEENIRDQIQENETWAMVVEKRRWQEYHTIEIIKYLALNLERRVNLRDPDKIIRVDVLGKRTAISLLGTDEIFSCFLPS